MAVRSIYFDEVFGQETEKNLPDQFHQYSDTEIWDRFINGDELAFTHIYCLYINRLFNFGKQFSTDDELVKDVIQDLFIRLRKQSNIRKILSIRSYLFKCFYRDLIKRIEKEKVFTREINESFAISFSAEHSLINEQIDELKRKSLTESLNKLPVRQRQALLFFYYEGLTYKEIAHIFNMKNVKSARKLVYRSIGKLRNIINPIFTRSFVTSLLAVSMLIR